MKGKFKMIEIKDGIITKDGKKIGTANQDLQYGYHPTVLVEVLGKKKRFGIETPKLIEKIKAYAEKESENL